MTRISTLAALTWSTLSFAQQAHLVCEAPRVWVEGALPTDWSGAVSKVCSELGHLNDLDPAAQAKLTTVAPRVKVSVRLNDGRTAERRLTNPARLLPTLEALMVLPRLPRRTDGDDATSPATQSSPPLPETVGASALALGGAVPNPSPDPVTETSPTAGADAESPVRHPLRHAAPSNSKEPVMTASRRESFDDQPLSQEVRFEVGVDLGARFGRDVALGPQLFGAYHLADWRVGAAIRWDPLSLATANGPPGGRPEGGPWSQSVVAEVQLARHFDVWRLGLDVGASPRLAVALPVGRFDLRGGVFARVGYRVGAFNLFASLDGEIGRASFSNASLPGSPVGFTGGLSLGAAWLGQ